MSDSLVVFQQYATYTARAGAVHSGLPSAYSVTGDEQQAGQCG